MTIGILRKGDRVISVAAEFIAIERKNGEVDIIPIVKDGKMLRVDIESVTTITYGNNIVKTDAGDVTITTF